MAEVQQFICSGCGGNLLFDAGLQALKCEACGNIQAIQTDSHFVIKEYPIEEAERMASTDWEAPTVTIKCQGCGTETVAQVGSGTIECAFCGSKHIVKHEEAPDAIKPESLVPFKVSKQTASQKFGAWLKSRWFAHKEAKQACSPEKLQGVYIPYWTFDSETSTYYTAEAGTYYYVTESRTVRDSEGKTKTVQERVRKTNWRWVNGYYDRFFNDLPVLASNNETKKVIEKLGDYNFSELIPYKPEYLTGFQAERYQVGISESFGIAKERMHQALMQDVRKQIHADEVRNISMQTNHNNVKFKHLLLPMWLSAFRFRDKIFRFVVNGQTGTIKGQYPKDPLKVLLVTVLGLAAVGALVYFLVLKNAA